MGYTNLGFVKKDKVANHLYTCRLDELESNCDLLNQMFLDGWLIESSLQTSDRIFLFLKMEEEGRKVIHIDVGGLDPHEIADYIERVKVIIKEEDGDYYVPNK